MGLMYQPSISILDQNNVRGTIPTELGLLTELKFFAARTCTYRLFSSSMDA